MLEIVFNSISAAEISKLSTLEQLDLFGQFKVSETTLQNIDGERFGKIESEGKVLYRFRAGNYRLYFQIQDDKVVVHRVLHKNTFEDFMFRSTGKGSEDEDLGKSKHFWQLIEEGQNASKS